MDDPNGKAPDPFAGVPARNTADYMLRTAQQHHAQISAMADTKANILITVSSIVLTLVLGQADEPELRPGLGVLAIFTLAALFLAVFAILPRVDRFDRLGSSLPPAFNLLFFGHFSQLSRERFRREMEAVLASDARVYETVVSDLYGLGSYLYRRKYRLLRWSYLSLLTGFVGACLLQLGIAAWVP
jgi:hypothetical protein